MGSSWMIFFLMGKFLGVVEKLLFDVICLVVCWLLVFCFGGSLTVESKNTRFSIMFFAFGPKTCQKHIFWGLVSFGFS